MSQIDNKLIPAEHRKYLRLDTVFPVQFRLEEPEGEVFLSAWLQGFTNNISQDGICLAINNLDPELFELLRKKNVKLSLEIDIPISRKPICARSSIVWVKDIFGSKHQYLVGIKYDYIPAQQNNNLMRYAWLKKLLVPVALALVVILAAGLGMNSYLNFKLTQGNKLLIEKLAVVLKDSSLAKQKIEDVIAQRQGLRLQLKALETQIKSVESAKVKAESQKVNIEADNLKDILELNDLILSLTKEKLILEAKLTNVAHKEDEAGKELSQLDQKKAVLQKANFDKMYQWLKIHQNSRTGLVASFEGDKEIANWSFTYDLALLIQAYTQFLDFDRAKQILDFFAHDAKRENGWFLNAYYSDDGAPAEFIMQSGPNLWVGLAIMQYMQFTKDQSYLDLAESIAATIINLQDSGSGGGIRGGPTVGWYSTEHNLDAYAFFNMLAQVTGKEVYSGAAQKAMNWMVKNTYDRPDLPVRRSKGDSTIATDTYAWSIAAIGPQKLKDLGMDPDKIMEFVEENCGVEVNFIRPNGQSVQIKGFDFAPQRHTSRGGVVSSEWTAQMVVSYKIMEEFYLKKGDKIKAANYGEKAQMYLSELGNMIISSPSASGQGEGCLPYATQDQVDTGHGWSTPKGSHTGSVSGTTYTLFAYYGFNPLELKE
ncbi:MAG: PilZ domain-containing protein [Candidatus Omnitrophica bacterium]|nr:PilZ domain-containing protein [Candidatus Omnitrophota bacterium]